MICNARHIQDKIHATIPLSQNMAYEIVELTDHGIYVRAPLAPNINIHGTGFAGSIYSLATLTAWALCYAQIEQLGVNAELVVARAAIVYKKPITSDIACKCHFPEAALAEFRRALQNGERAKANLQININQESAILEALLMALPTQ